jgi:ectoine hydroxylase-related dioxygenase (phytanoyl-CoA dioxygenase family)
LTEQPSNQLEEQGFLFLTDVLDTDVRRALRGRLEELFASEGAAAGADFKQEPGTRRLANLLNKGDVFHQLVAHQATMRYVRQILGDVLKLSSLNARSANANSGQRQPLHADMGAVADNNGYWVANIVWLLDDFTLTNGTLRVVPGSHRWNQLPQDALDDPTAEHPDEQVITGRAGDAIVMNAHLWHAGMENRSAADRLALHSFYCRRDKPQQQYQKRMLSADVQDRLSPELRDILALDDPLNDELSSQDVVRSGFLK